MLYKQHSINHLFKLKQMNYGTLANANELYPVIYTVAQNGDKIFKPQLIKGADLTEPQIKYLHELGYFNHSTQPPSVPPVDAGAGVSEEKSIEAWRAEGLPLLMAMVRTGYSQAALDISQFCIDNDVPDALSDKVISMLNRDNKREFVYDLFKQELEASDLLPSTPPTKEAEAGLSAEEVEDMVRDSLMQEYHNKEEVDEMVSSATMNITGNEVTVKYDNGVIDTWVIAQKKYLQHIPKQLK
jgi:hypothetical protein